MTATVWRVRWDGSVLDWFSEWSIHFDAVRNHADELSAAMPGANVRVESAKVTDVARTQDMDFNGSMDYDGEPDRSHPFTITTEGQE
jgi:hypothetical protein